MVGTQRPTTWKVGAPSRDGDPVSGAIFPQFRVQSPACFPRDAFLNLGIEAEIAVRFGHDLPQRVPPYTRQEIVDAVDHACVAIEIVTTRLADRHLAGPLWRLADNLVNGALVLGDEIPAWRQLDYRGLTARSYSNGKLVAEATGDIPLGDICHCLPWWINHIGGVRAGDMVTTGTWNGACWVEGPQVVKVEFAGIGSAQATIT